MNTASEQIRNQQKETWNRFSPGWKKWDAFNMVFLQPLGDAIIAALQLGETGAVLDIATGTGEPGLTIAATYPKSSVIGTDLSDGMLAVAEERGRSRGLANYHPRVADVSALPFPDGSFDAVSCRLGFMFFPEMPLAVKEMARVLKPGGKIATSVWSTPDKNPWITTMMGAIQPHVALPPPMPGAPGIFRCAAPGLIAGFFREAGLIQITEQEITGQVTFESADQYWTMMLEVAAPVVTSMSKADEPTRARIKDAVYGELARFNGPPIFAFGARNIAGTKA